MSTDFYHTHIAPNIGIIHKLCRAYTDSQADFEDYYQEVCLQLWRSHQNYKGQSEWSTWVYRVTLNVCMTLLKKRKKQPVDYSDTHQLKDTLIQDQSAQYQNEDFALLFEAIKKLSEVDRGIILLYLEEHSYADIAEIIGLNANTVGVRITRIKSKLKSLLDGKIN